MRGSSEGTQVERISPRLRSGESATIWLEPVEFGNELATDQAKVGRRERIAKRQVMGSRVFFVLV